MSSLPALFSLFFRGRGHRVGWRRTLATSAWSLFPAVFSSTTRGNRGLNAVPLFLRNGQREESDQSHTATSLLDSSRVFLRRGRTTRNSGDTPRAADAEGDVQLDVMKGAGVADDRALRAFDRWAKRTGGCSANEFIQGVHQSYYGLGVLCDTLAEAAKPQLPLGKSVSLAGALDQLKRLLKKQYAVSPTALAEEVKILGEKTTKGRHRTAKVVAEALTQVLPISLEFGENMYNMWNKQRVFDSNVLRIAAPNDYILSTSMVFFHECHNLKEVHFAKDIPLAVIAIPPSPSAARKAAKGVETSSNAQAESSAERKLATETQPSKEKKPAANKTEGTDAVRGETIITFKGRPLPKIPASAVACVVASMDVVTPPQRYDPNFDWYYQRITGHESEYQRIAVARFFAMSNAQVILSPLDFLIRMFTGRNLELTCPPGISDLIGIPKNIAECPPAMRKLLCFYMDADGRWVLSDLFCVDSVATPLTTKTAPA